MTPPTKETDDAVVLAAAIRDLLRELTVRAQDKSGDGRIAFSGTELALLGYLYENPGAMARELAAFLGLTPTTIQSILDRLVRRELIARAPHQTDRRAVALSLTHTGQDAITRIRAQDIANCQAMLSILPEDRRSVLASDIARIAAALTNRPNR